MLEKAVREITEALQKADGRIVYVYVRPSQQHRDPCLTLVWDHFLFAA